VVLVALGHILPDHPDCVSRQDVAQFLAADVGKVLFVAGRVLADGRSAQSKDETGGEQGFQWRHGR